MFCSALTVERLYEEYCSVQDHSEGLDHTREHQRSWMLMCHYLNWRTMTWMMAVHTLDKSMNSCYSSELRTCWLTHHCMCCEPMHRFTVVATYCQVTLLDCFVAYSTRKFGCLWAWVNLNITSGTEQEKNRPSGRCSQWFVRARCGASWCKQFVW